MAEEADDKIDILEAVETGLLVSSGLAFSLGFIYFLAFVDVMAAGMLRQIPFPFVVVSMIIVFNLSFSFALIDQLRS